MRPKQKPRNGAESPFQLPPGITVSKQTLPGALAYVFRHKELGELGRILVQARGSDQSQISCEVVGDPDDPMTAVRTRIFEPLGIEITNLLEQQTGSVPPSEWNGPAPSPPRQSERIECKLMQCETCDAFVALLIFAPEATEPAHFEDYARLMYPEYTRHNLPTWIIGPSLGSGPMELRPADILPVWPKCSPIERLRPDEFTLRTEALAKKHCAQGSKNDSMTY